MNRPESLLGQQIEGYHLTKFLGSGRFADVYEAWTQAGEQVALKLLRPDTGNGGQAHARLAQEAEAVATIRHVNVIGYRGGGLFQERLWIVVDLVDGSDLRKRAGAPGGLQLEQLLDFVRQACEGVAAAHRKGIIHRDLKPENILITSQSVAKVADFGSAKLASWGVQTTPQEEVSSALYLAPESVRPGESEPERDVFSIGVILYELLSGTHPIGDETLNITAVVQRLVAYAPPPPLATLGRGIPLDVSDLVQRALSPEPAQRGSMQALADALEAAQQRLLTRKRANARSLPVPGQEIGMARTELEMPRMDVRGGTIPMPQAPPARRTTLPPVPAGPVTAPTEMRRAPARTLAMALPEPGSLDDWRSTGAPVEKAGPRPSAAGVSAASRRRRFLVVTASAVVVGAGLAGTGWLLSGSPPPPAPRPAAAPPRASASAAGPASASAAPPRTGPPGARGTGKRARP